MFFSWRRLSGDRSWRMIFIVERASEFGLAVVVG